MKIDHDRMAVAELRVADRVVRIERPWAAAGDPWRFKLDGELFPRGESQRLAASVDCDEAGELRALLAALPR